MNKSDRYLCDDLERAALNREIVKRKIMLDDYPSQAGPENLREPSVEELLLEVLQDEENQ